MRTLDISGSHLDQNTAVFLGDTLGHCQLEVEASGPVIVYVVHAMRMLYVHVMRAMQESRLKCNVNLSLFAIPHIG